MYIISNIIHFIKFCDIIKIIINKNNMKLYTKEQLFKKYSGAYIKVYPHHFDKWNNKTNKYDIVYEIQGTSKELKEDFNTPEELFNN